MLTLNTIKSKNQKKQNKKRIGRGAASGWGATSGKGNNGARARSGFKNKLHFEGGQLPLLQRLPKVGFTNIFKVKYQIVNVADIEALDFEEKELDANWFYNNGLVHSIEEPIKILGNGDLNKSLTIKASKFSKSAVEKIEKANGKAEVV